LSLIHGQLKSVRERPGKLFSFPTIGKVWKEFLDPAGIDPRFALRSVLA